MKKALITGITGQDAAYLSKHLLEKGYEVYGAARRSASEGLDKLEYLGIKNDVHLEDIELLEESNIIRLIQRVMPDELYNLAAQSFVAASFHQPLYTSEADGLGVLRVLEALRLIKPDTKFYQASSSEMFGKVQEVPQNEKTYFYPRSPYGVSKLYAHWMTVNYRESYDMFCCSGILFNHESPLRGPEFVTRKITLGLNKIKQGQQDHIALGNLDSKRDWGFAGDYVEGMYLMLQQPKADDYVLASGEMHSVRDFVNCACKALDINIEWEGTGQDEVGIDTSSGKKIVQINRNYFRPAEVQQLKGDSSKARKILGWKPKVSFEQLVEMMVETDKHSLDHNPRTLNLNDQLSLG
ncbi:GDP-mannose 4,6-dehydratase [bacterium]|nr:GDP-mannose 4,6-dehydratase [bacterium]